jgi:hypothetical protein
MRHLTFDNKKRRQRTTERFRYLELEGVRTHQGTDRAQQSSMGQQTQEALGPINAGCEPKHYNLASPATLNRCNRSVSQTADTWKSLCTARRSLGKKPSARKSRNHLASPPQGAGKY